MHGTRVSYHAGNTAQRQHITHGTSARLTSIPCPEHFHGRNKSSVMATHSLQMHATYRYTEESVGRVRANTSIVDQKIVIS